MNRFIVSCFVFIIITTTKDREVDACGNGICRTPFGQEYTGGSCGDQICDNYGLAPRFDDSDRPPNREVNYLMLAPTFKKGYLPYRVSPVQKAAFVSLATSVAVLYPGKGQELYASVFYDPVIKKELEAIVTKEDAQLWCWKVHNAVSAAVFPTRSPFPQSLGLASTSFKIGPASSNQQFYLRNLSPALKRVILTSLNTRWIAPDAQPAITQGSRDLLNLPPDRTTLGRAFWTYLHTMSVYIPHNPSAVELAAFRSMFGAMYSIFPCSVCKAHFQTVYEDAIVQDELNKIASKHGAIMFVWKLHNIVTANGIQRNQWPNRPIFPPRKKLEGLGMLNVSEFLVPSTTSDLDQIQLTSKCSTSTATCLDKYDRYDILSDVQSRWEIEGGIDQPLEDDAPIAACSPPQEGQPLVRVDMYLMGKCPWCANAMEAIADFIQCDFKCVWKDQPLSARLDFQLHFVGLNNGTFQQPSLIAIHGPSELVAERLELCARKHYSKNYQYIRFMKCMDANVTTIPLRAPQCAEEAGMDLATLHACANAHGERLVAQSYGFASWMGIETVPTFVFDRHKQILGLPKNFSDVLCERVAARRAVIPVAQSLVAGAGTSKPAGQSESSVGAAEWIVMGLAGALLASAAVAWLVLPRRKARAEYMTLSDDLAAPRRGLQP